MLPSAKSVPGVQSRARQSLYMLQGNTVSSTCGCGFGQSQLGAAEVTGCEVRRRLNLQVEPAVSGEPSAFLPTVAWPETTRRTLDVGPSVALRRNCTRMGGMFWSEAVKLLSVYSAERRCRRRRRSPRSSPTQKAISSARSLFILAFHSIPRTADLSFEHWRSKCRLLHFPASSLLAIRLWPADCDGKGVPCSQQKSAALPRQLKPGPSCAAALPESQLFAAAAAALHTGASQLKFEQPRAR